MKNTKASEPRKLYISDWHFGHANVLNFDNRPFLTIENMNEELIRRWNKAVRPQDTVYVLGDMFWCDTDRAVEVLGQLNGTKILVKGNHDKVHDKRFKDMFAKITDYLEVEDDGRHVVLCHYPIPCYKNHYHNWFHFYGHVHNSFEYNITEHQQMLMRDLYQKPSEMYNVGCMMPWMDYTPRTMDEILTGAKKK